MPRTTYVAGLLVLTLLLAACGDETAPDQDSAAPTDQAEEPAGEPVADDAPTPATEEPEAGDGPIATIEEVENATVQILAEGAFEDPDFGAFESAGAGSGFLIDPSGLIVTNNHVVTGAAVLEVTLAGEDRPRNATVLGVSECSDLAVIQVAGEGDHPYLEWYDENVSAGLEVYAAGYPLGDPEFTLTKGIVSKANYDIETEWASVENIIEHDARILEGNSGGPLLTADAKVVGVNYALSHDTSQNLAINAGEAREIVETLKTGQDVTSLGVNGFAVGDGEGNVGVWVSSVASGSVADKTGVRGGDLITSIENVVIGEDGTMSRYCAILRSRNASDTMAVEVYRDETDELLAGQFNGRELETTFSFAQEFEGDESLDSGDDADSYDEYVTVSDDTGRITVDVPAEWSDVDGSPFEYEGAELFDVSASSDLDGFFETWTTPGMSVTASVDLADTMDEIDVIDTIAEDYGDACSYDGRFEYEDPLYTGSYDRYTDCGGESNTLLVLGAVPEDGSYVIVVEVQAVALRDFEALDRVLETFVVD